MKVSPPILFVWNKSYDIGIQAIDDQHKQIIDYINYLFLARFKKDKNEIERIFGLMIKYTHSHFSLEESLMEKAGYQDLQEHKQKHLVLVGKLNGYMMRYFIGKNDPFDIAEELQKTMIEWLLDHIRHDDASYGPSVKKYLEENPLL